MTFLGSGDPDDYPGSLPREAREAVEEARQHDRDNLENDPFALCYLEGMQSDILPSRRRRRVSLERREY